MEIYQIHIVLARFRPKIWRRILIQPDLLLSDFNLAIQIAMGWENSHLHQFIKNKTFYTERMNDAPESNNIKKNLYLDDQLPDHLVKPG